jgi:hypothetical protein
MNRQCRQTFIYALRPFAELTKPGACSTWCGPAKPPACEPIQADLIRCDVARYVQSRQAQPAVAVAAKAELWQSKHDARTSGGAQPLAAMLPGK